MGWVLYKVSMPLFSNSNCPSEAQSTNKVLHCMKVLSTFVWQIWCRLKSLMGVSFVTGATELQAASTREWIQLHKEKRRQESLPPEFPITRTRAWDPKTNKMDWEKVLRKQQEKGGHWACFCIERQGMGREKRRMSSTCNSVIALGIRLQCPSSCGHGNRLRKVYSLQWLA